jgi:threonine aldolase
MLESILSAELGDDQLDGDPTVRKLEELAARKMGKEEALLVTSGTQGNLVSVMAQTERGDEVIIEDTAHMLRNEAGGIACLAGLLVKRVKGHMGVMDSKEVENRIAKKTTHSSGTKLICIENTHNSAGGTCWTPNQTAAIGQVAKASGLRLHLDGARIFNAAVALDVDVRELVGPVDSLSFCLSKGLSGPAGSLVIGDHAFIEKARRIRQMLGGALRQGGVIAAPGIIALETMVHRIREDHTNAQILAKGLVNIEGLNVDLRTVQTNIVMLNLQELGIQATDFANKLASYGVRVSVYGPYVARFVTHRGIEKEHINYTLDSVKNLVTSMKTTTMTPSK